MEITLTTPSLLFPAISLLLLAFTNRFLALASLIRNLHTQYQDQPDRVTSEQILRLRHRVELVRNMQAAGVASLLLCVLCMFVLFAGAAALGKLLFALSLVLMLVSLGLSLREIQLSVNALEVLLADFEPRHQPARPPEERP